MGEDEKQYLTRDGYEEKLAELEHLKVVRRKEVAEKLKEAREQGDLSENAEWDAAKDEQRDIEQRIAELEEIINNSEIIENDSKNKTKVKMGSTVTLLATKTQKETVVKIVGAKEADILERKISMESPIGAAIAGKKKGDIVTVVMQTGEVEYKIVSVDNNILNFVQRRNEIV